MHCEMRVKEPKASTKRLIAINNLPPIDLPARTIQAASNEKILLTFGLARLSEGWRRQGRWSVAFRYPVCSWDRPGIGIPPPCRFAEREELIARASAHRTSSTGAHRRTCRSRSAGSWERPPVLTDSD